MIYLCTGNSARSQMAEGIWREFGGDRFDFLSGGLEPKGIHPLIVKVMEEIGISLDGQTSKGVGEYLGKLYLPYVFTVCGHAEENCPSVFLNQGKHTHWEFEDPDAFKGSEKEKLAKFREVRDQIENPGMDGRKSTLDQDFSLFGRKAVFQINL